MQIHNTGNAQYGPELVYIKGEDNVVADGLSRLDIDERDFFFGVTIVVKPVMSFEWSLVNIKLNV